MIEIKRLILGMVRTNCYIVYTKDTKKAVIIDPAAEANKIIRTISKVPESFTSLILTASLPILITQKIP